ncbi:MAG: riboflavin biosynthesis protein RibF, partial [Deltaproteobacteria bacterium]|nr:riboflavin biosynthesis protein RibF [Deltaproteobacteria bacterium]
SSTRARRAVAAGELDVARAVLGRPHALTGRVVHGDGRGRTIGVPTANLDGIEELLPPHGVYACLVDRAREGEGFLRLGTGVLNVGNRPTVSAGWSAEVHVHGDPGDLYGDRLRVHLLSFLRPEHRFPSLEALVVRIREDVETARRRAEGEAPDPLAGGAWA